MGMEEPVYIARISYGKDSLKMLDVIKTRGLPLDRITTTDVWATDTISASLPEIDAFKKRMDGWILERYGIPVEHLCARNPDGTIRSYEQMFYHVPKRRSQDVQVEREREREPSKHGPGTRNGFPVLGVPWCQSALKRNASERNDPRIPGPVEPLVSVRPQAECGGVESTRDSHWIPSKHGIQLVPKAQDPMDSQHRSLPTAGSSRSTRSGTPFSMGGPRIALRKEKSWNTLGSRRTSRSGSDS